MREGSLVVDCVLGRKWKQVRWFQGPSANPDLRRGPCALSYGLCAGQVDLGTMWGALQGTGFHPTDMYWAPPWAQHFSRHFSCEFSFPRGGCILGREAETPKKVLEQGDVR